MIHPLHVDNQEDPIPWSMPQQALRFVAGFLLLSNMLVATPTLREFQFKTYAHAPISGLTYQPVNEAALTTSSANQPFRTIEFHPLAAMGPYSFSGGSVITFYEEPTREVVARVRVPEHSNQWLFIFVRNPRYADNPQAQLKYLVYSLDHSLVDWPQDQLIFLNFSSQPIEGLINGTRVQIGLGQSAPIKVDGSNLINLWTPDASGQRFLPALIKTYPFEIGHRYLILLFPPVLRGSSDLDVRFLAEKVE